MPDPMRALRGATSIGPDPNVPSREGLTGFTNWLISLGIPIYPEQEVGVLDLAAAVPPLKGLKSLAALAKTEKAAEAAADVATGIRAYHGSPHDFERFTLEKIGTGEGAQAYGHGLYFAEKEGTARSYRDNLSNFGQTSAMPEDMTTSVLLDNKVVSGRTPSNQLTPLERAALAKHYAGGLQAQAIRETEDTLKYLTPGSPAYLQEQETLAALKEHDLTGRVQPFQGRMYEVNIEGHLDDFLDWDTPLSEAHAEKLKGLVPGQMSIPSEGLDMGGGSRILPNHNRQVSNKPYPYILKSGDAEFGISEKDVARMIGGGETPTGQQVYARLSAALGGDPQATEALRKAGVPGIRYLDQGSRRAGTGTRNFVVFDDKLIDILRKYGLLPPIGAMALSQFARPRSEAR